MWTRKAAFTFTGGIALVLIGMMISNQQMMILGLSLIAVHRRELVDFGPRRR